MADAVIQEFLQAHPDELINGQLKVCIGGGAGFIGSHIAKKFKEMVNMKILLKKRYDNFFFFFINFCSNF